MKRLNQILAVEQSSKKRLEDTFTKTYQDVQKADLSSGFTRVYTPKNENGEPLPSETKRVVVRGKDAIQTARKALSELFDLAALKDNTNATAKADLIVDGKVLVADVPAVHLLFLEKRMTGIIDFIRKLPTLPLDESWALDAGSDLFVSSPVESIRTAKIEDHKVEGLTDKFPGHLVKVTKDVVQGTWKTTKFSGGLPAGEIQALLAKAERLQRAIKTARQEANEAPVEPLATGDAVMNYIFG
jgi:hypothetical protein